MPCQQKLVAADRPFAFDHFREELDDLIFRYHTTYEAIHGEMQARMEEIPDLDEKRATAVERERVLAARMDIWKIYTKLEIDLLGNFRRNFIQILASIPQIFLAFSRKKCYIADRIVCCFLIPYLKSK